MACLQSFDPLLGGHTVSRSSATSLEEDLKDDKVRRQQDAGTHEGENEAAEADCAANQRWMWVEHDGISSHRTFIATGERYEMVSRDTHLYSLLLH